MMVDNWLLVENVTVRSYSKLWARLLAGEQREKVYGLLVQTVVDIISLTAVVYSLQSLQSAFGLGISILHVTLGQLLHV